MEIKKDWIWKIHLKNLLKVFEKLNSKQVIFDHVRIFISNFWEEPNFANLQ